jgi:hypothetical protein
MIFQTKAIVGGFVNCKGDAFVSGCRKWGRSLVEYWLDVLTLLCRLIGLKCCNYCQSEVGRIVIDSKRNCQTDSGIMGTKNSEMHL